MGTGRGRCIEVRSSDRSHDLGGLGDDLPNTDIDVDEPRDAQETGRRLALPRARASLIDSATMGS